MDVILDRVLILLFLMVIATTVQAYSQSRKKGGPLEPWFSQQLLLALFMALQILGRMSRSHDTLYATLAAAGLVVALVYTVRAVLIVRRQLRWTDVDDDRAVAFEAFTERAKRVLFLARYEAFVAKSAAIGALHLLLGILLEADPQCTQVIEQSGASAAVLAELVRQRPRQSVPVRPSWLRRLTSREIPFGPELKAILARASVEARELGHERIEVVHLLLGLLAVSPAECGTVFSAARLSYDSVRSQLLTTDG